MEDYINDSLTARIMCPSSSPVAELLQGATIFSKHYLCKAYHLFHIREVFAFNALTGLYEYLVMPFILNNAPTTFQAMVNDYLYDMLNLFVFVYLKDILIFSKSREDRIHDVQCMCSTTTPGEPSP